MEPMDTKPTNIGFTLTKITTEQFAILESNLDAEGAISINTNLRFAADELKKMVGVFAAFIFESNQKQFLIIEAGCHFSILSEAWENMLNIEAGQLIIPKGFMQHLAMLTVGTARGILHAKTEGSCFNKYHLPTINVTGIIKEDSIFQFEKKEAQRD
jgi:hypothetical protein